MKPLLTIFSLLFLLSCAANKEYFKVQESSVFVSANELETSKATFISKYGEPLNKDLRKEGEDIIESLYYIENVKGIIITTKIKFVNDKLVEQSNYNMDTSDKRFKELEEQLRSTELQIFMSGMKK